MSRHTVEAFVLSQAKDSSHYFAYSNVISRDLIINSKFVPPGVNIIGKWVRVVVRDHNSVCQKIMIIDDVFECRVINGVPEIKVQAVQDGVFEDKYQMFYHDYFGYFCDTSNIFQNVKRNGIYTFWVSRMHEPRINARWKVSSDQIDSRQNQAAGNSSLSRELEAFVHSYSLDRKSLYAWSISEPRKKIDICLSICDPTKEFLGTWIKVKVNKGNHAQAQPVVINDVYETRVKYGVTEIHVDFDAGNTPGLLYNNYFGNISDPLKILPRVEQNVWYKGWITFHIIRTVDARWRLAKDQQIEGPFNIPNSGPLLSSNNRKYEERLYDYKSNHISSPDVRNEYQRSRSPSPQNFHFKSKLSNDNCIYELQKTRLDHKLQDNLSHKKLYELEPYSFDNNSFEYDDRFYEHVQRKNNNCHNDQNSRSKEGVNYLNGFNDETPIPILRDSQTVEDVRKVTNRRSRSPKRRNSKINRLKSPDSEYYTCTEDEAEKNDKHQHRTKQENVPEATDVAHINKNDYRNLTTRSDGQTSKKPESIDSKQQDTIEKSGKTGEEKEVKLLKLKLSRISRLIHCLTEDDDIAQKMKLLGIEEYEELMRLVKL